ncbi:Phosphotyrosyl phosphatase activator [Ceratobasidium sp. AG-I]|nr:Phosphotyrosyl phosphatase activator [Ceratobasidium sp. AG-I]
MEHSSVVNLPRIPVSDIASLEQHSPPRPLIQTDTDVLDWQHSACYSDLLLYIRRLGESVVGVELGTKPTEGASEQSIHSLLRFLEELNTWVEEIPPQESPQRYGNLAFRDWGQRLEERSETLLREMLPESLHAVIPFLQPYVLTSFGSFVRIDYGTGHELSFVVFLLCLHKIGFLPSEVQVERSTVLEVFVKYLHVCWRLQDIYKLEPAGSHGVWGLDDYSFLGYFWGSAQLRDQPNAVPSSVLRRPFSDLPTDLYTLSIVRVNTIKTGPFHEHSPQLYSIASSVPVWRKVNSGLLKMYEAEVLSKRVVVQHLPLGEPFMPFNKSHPYSYAPPSIGFQPASIPPSRTLPSNTTSVSRGPTTLLPPLRPRPHPSTGSTSPFAAPSSGARFTVSRAAGRGNIPGAMGSRQVALPIGDMGPPVISMKHGHHLSSSSQEKDIGAHNESSEPADSPNPM